MTSDKNIRKAIEYRLKEKVRGMKPEQREEYLDNIATHYYLGGESFALSDESFEHLDRRISINEADRIFD